METKKIIKYSLMAVILLLVSGYAMSTSNLGNVIINGLLTVTNDTNITGDVILGTGVNASYVINPADLCPLGSTSRGSVGNLGNVTCIDEKVQRSGDTMTGDLNFTDNGIYISGNKLSDSVTVTVAANNSNNKESADYRCDGTDDQVEIQAALDSLSASGGKVFLLEGNYTVSETITISGDNVHFQGSGFGTFINSSGVEYTGSSSHGIKATGDYVIVSDLYLVGGGRASGIGPYYGVLSRGDYSLLTRLYVTDFAYECIGMKGDYSTISNSIAKRAGDDCFASTGNRFSKIINNYAEHPGGVGGPSCYEVEMSAEYIDVIGNICNASDLTVSGIEIHTHPGEGNCRYITVTGNVVYGATIGTYYVDANAEHSEYITIADNIVYNSSISIRAMNNVVVDGNVVLTNKTHAFSTYANGILPENIPTNILVSNNYFETTTTNRVVNLYALKDSTIIGNHIIGTNTGQGIQFNMLMNNSIDNIAILDNWIKPKYPASSKAISWSGFGTYPTQGHTFVQGNTVFGTGTVLYIPDSADVTIRNNQGYYGDTDWTSTGGLNFNGGVVAHGYSLDFTNSTGDVAGCIFLNDTGFYMVTDTTQC